MKREPGAPILSAIFVDYDNVYMSLRRKSEDAAKRFPKAAVQWLKALETGSLVTTTTPFLADGPRRIVSIRCYGNSVPRRNAGDNSTDMNSFPFVRHHFLRAGCEVVDCPPLTSHHKNAADIRMVMDLRDYLTHATYFDEFVILSGDADFTPVLHRLRQHARRTVIYSNDHTASAYSAICDGEVREMDLIGLLLSGAEGAVLPEPEAAAVQMPASMRGSLPPPAAAAQPTGQLRIDDLRALIMTEVVTGIRAASGPVPLEALADRALRAIGHERTIGTAWAGAGTFRDLLRLALPTDLRMTEQAPFFAYDPERHAVAMPAAEPVHALLEADAPLRPQALTSRPASAEPSLQPHRNVPAPLTQRAPLPEPHMHRGTTQRSAGAPTAPQPRAEFDVHRAMARIQEACQAPPLSPQDYRVLFDVAAREIGERGLSANQTVTAIQKRAADRGLTTLRRQDVQFVLDVVGEADPWFEQAPTAALFAGRFRNFVVARCREHGLMLSMRELDLIDSWFMSSEPTAPMAASAPPQPQVPAISPPVAAAPMLQAPRAIEPPAAKPARVVMPPAAAAAPAAARQRWWAGGEANSDSAATPPGADVQNGANEPAEEDFPRFVRQRR